MTQAQTYQWTGKSGTVYQYEVYPIGQPFRHVPGNYIFPVPGNYIFAFEIGPACWWPIYIGQTADLRERFGDHHKESCIKAYHATHIHAHRNYGGEPVRRDEEADLVANYNPACNG